MKFNHLASPVVDRIPALAFGEIDPGQAPEAVFLEPYQARGFL
jgi:hypothetical protein